MADSLPQPTPRRNANRAQARRALLWAIGMFLLAQMALGFILAHDNFAIRDPVRHGRLKILRERIAEAPSPPKVVILLGSSQVEVGLLARQMSLEVSEKLGRPVVVANQGVRGGAAFRSLLAMDRLLREGIVPDLVIVETFPAFFTTTTPYNDAPEAALPLDLLDDTDVKLLRRYAIDRPDLDADRYRKFVPGYSFRANLTNTLAPWLLHSARLRVPPLEESPWIDNSPELRVIALAKARDEYRRDLQNLSLGDPRQMRAVDELVRRLCAKGTTVVFLAMPEGPLFRSWYPADRWAESVVWLRDLADRHGVRSIDAREWSDREEWFLDSHHLTAEGAEEFSRWLGREVAETR